MSVLLVLAWTTRSCSRWRNGFYSRCTPLKPECLSQKTLNVLRGWGGRWALDWLVLLLLRVGARVTLEYTYYVDIAGTVESVEGALFDAKIFFCFLLSLNMGMIREMKHYSSKWLWYNPLKRPVEQRTRNSAFLPVYVKVSLWLF